MVPPRSVGYPVATFIGSPNYGYRSADKDLELQLGIISESAELGSLLKNELDSLFEHSKQSPTEEEQTTAKVRLVSKLCRHWL